MKLLKTVEDIKFVELVDYINKRAESIVRSTQGDSWDDPESWQTIAVELAHATFRLLNEKIGKE